MSQYPSEIEELKRRREMRSQRAKAMWENPRYQARKWKWKVISLEGPQGKFWDRRASLLNCKAGKVFVMGSFLLALWEEQNNSCYYCGKELDWKKKGEVTVDHVMPGKESKNNLVICCDRCNRIKSNATLEDLEMITKGIRKHITPKRPEYAIWLEFGTGTRWRYAIAMPEM